MQPCLLLAGRTGGQTVELADINSDDLVDILFANGGNHDMPGKPDHSKVFLNQGPDQSLEDATRCVLPKAMLARVIKVRDVERRWIARYPCRHHL